eukprot:1700918-Pleurochrysis_carterae.AAC.1
MCVRAPLRSALRPGRRGAREGERGVWKLCIVSRGIRYVADIICGTQLTIYVHRDRTETGATLIENNRAELARAALQTRPPRARAHQAGARRRVTTRLPAHHYAPQPHTRPDVIVRSARAHVHQAQGRGHRLLPPSPFRQ